jgi:hypothetical protein
MSKDVAIIGLGISGLTTAILLQRLGYSVTIYSDKADLLASNDPLIASSFPAASIIPHSVYHNNLNDLFSESQSLFSKLYKARFPGVEIHRHFELFNSKTLRPEYLSRMNRVIDFPEIDWMPRHPEIKINDGWEFECFFTDWDIYFSSLLELFKDQNGYFVNDKVDLNLYSSIKENIIVNCAGIGSCMIDSEDANPLLLLGHLLKKKNTPILKDRNGMTISYNFTPGKDIYSTSDGHPLDVYFYPRNSDWVLGGSRFEVLLDQKGDWKHKDQMSVQFPQQIVQINHDILLETFGIDSDDFKEETYQEGIRYLRNRNNGLRLDAEKVGDKLIIHNYGHGGAGVTLSWGCAYRIASTIKTELNNHELTLEETIQQLSL